MYKLNNAGSIVRLSDGVNIPGDPDNRDFDEYQEWLDAGNTPEPADPVIATYSITPQMPLVRLSSASIDVVIQVSGDPGKTNLLIDGVPMPITLDDKGKATVNFEIASVGEYVITGESGKLANCVAVIKAVG